MSNPTPPAENPTPTPSAANKHWEPPSPVELQALMPGYTIEKLLGKGGMGAVYKGIQESLDRPVAIKIISNDLDEADASYGERFKNEAKAMAKLSHPGIVAVHSYGQTENGLHYIVMEYIEGTDVAKMISQQKRLHTDHAMAITAHVCDALAYAHERGIIHRDIKPANIMVSYEGVVKVADFGLAKMTQSGESGLTQSGMAMGTLHYMAPEALMLGSAVDHRADIYAVGVMLYQMLTGKVPHGMFELPSMQVPGLDPRYDAIIAKAMREDRELRYQSVRELRVDLDSILTQPVVQVDPAVEQAPAALPTSARPQRPAGQPYRPPQSQTSVYVQKKSSPLPWLALLVVVGFAAWFWFGRSRSEPMAGPVVETPAPKQEPKADIGSTAKAPASSTPAAAKSTVAAVSPKITPPAPNAPLDPMPSVSSLAAPDTAELRRGLVSWWKADSDARDTVGTNHGKLAGAASFVDGLYGGAFQFDGGYMEVPDSPTLQFGPDSKFTVTFWAYRTSEKAPFHFFGKRNDKRGDTGGMKGYQLGFSGSTPQFKLNEWTLWVVAYDGSKQSIYLDGEPLFTLGKIASGETAPFRIGKSGDYESFKGRIDDVRVYDRAMTIEEIKTMFSSRNAKPEPAKIALATTPELAALQQQFVKLQAERVTAVFDADITKLNTGYLGGLDREMAKERAAGRLDGVLALEEEKKLVQGVGASSSPLGKGGQDGHLLCPIPATDDARANAAVKNLRIIYREAYARLEAVRATNLKALTDPLATRLKALESDLTKQNRIADAKAVREYRETLPAAEAAVSYSASNPFINSLGMKFVPVPGTEVLFCTTITRATDYDVFATEAGLPTIGALGGDQRDTKQVPVNQVSWNNARAFCEWLSKKDGKLYRLPTDREWSIAVGIGSQEFKDATPQDLDGKLKGIFPWGSQWPPPSGGAGNYCDESYREFCIKGGYTGAPHIKGYTDGEVAISPVETFKPNKYGLHDIGGNLWQWCEDWYDAAKTQKLLRGGCWDDSDKARLLSSARWPNPPNFLETKTNRTAFRCVLMATSLAAGGGTRTAAPLISAAPATPTTGSASSQGALPAATKDQPHVNTLGMKFVPVPGIKVQMCIHETRKGDYAAFASENPSADDSWKNVRTATPDRTPISAADDHPVVNVNWEDATAFCAWLSRKEGKTYRLPTDREWSVAVGLGTKESSLGTPESLNEKIKNVYPWGGAWPPPNAVGNYSDLSAAAKLPGQKIIAGYTDGHATTAPVMSFAPNALGIYDLSGNVWEFCGDWFNASKKKHVLRGGSWGEFEDHWLLSSSRDPFDATSRFFIVGFRCVLEVTTP